MNSWYDFELSVSRRIVCDFIHRGRIYEEQKIRGLYGGVLPDWFLEDKIGWIKEVAKLKHPWPAGEIIVSLPTLPILECQTTRVKVEEEFPLRSRILFRLLSLLEWLISRSRLGWSRPA